MANLLSQYEEQKTVVLRNLTKTSTKKKKDKKEEEENERLKTKVRLLDSNKMLVVLKVYLNQCVQNKEIAQSSWISCMNEYKNNYERLVLEVGPKPIINFMLRNQNNPRILPD